jgi:SAM-dependent methyltransferase
MQKCRDRYLAPGKGSESELPVVVELGSHAGSASYRHLFPGEDFAFIGYDIRAGDSVDIVLTDAYHIPLPDASVDVVISGQLFQQCADSYRFFDEMMRILRRNGHLFLVAPSASPEFVQRGKRAPFTPDGYRDLARHAGCRLVGLWHDDRGPEHDLVGVFRPFDADPEPSDASRSAEIVTLEYRRWLLSTGSVGSFHDAPTEATQVAGSLPYLELLGRLHERLTPRLYFEIGVSTGDSLALASGTAIGIDPLSEVTVELPARASIREMTSDYYFDSDLPSSDLADGIDLAFIDGLHQFEQCLRDFMNVERSMAPGGLVVIDDILPSHPLQAERRRRSSIWMGDAWRMAFCLKVYRPDLLVLIVDTRPSGLMLVAGLDPASRQLWDQYNVVVDEAASGLPLTAPPSVLERDGVIAPDDARIDDLLSLLQGIRKGGLSHAGARARLQAWRAEHMD